MDPYNNLLQDTDESCWYTSELSTRINEDIPDAIIERISKQIKIKEEDMDFFDEDISIDVVENYTIKEEVGGDIETSIIKEEVVIHDIQSVSRNRQISVKRFSIKIRRIN